MFRFVYSVLRHHRAVRREGRGGGGIKITDEAMRVIFVPAPPLFYWKEVVVMIEINFFNRGLTAFFRKKIP